MLTLLADYANLYGPLNLFSYLTFRTGGAMLTALFFALLFGPRMIARLRAFQGQGQPIRSDGPQGHLQRKSGTPTLGGLLILCSFLAAVLLWADLGNGLVGIVLFSTLGFAAVGLADDLGKLRARDAQGGLPVRTRLILEALIALSVVLLIGNFYRAIGFSGEGDQDLTWAVSLPVFKNAFVDLGWFFPFFGLIVIVGSANAVNLTDGLDGLAIMPVIIACAAFGLIAYLSGRYDYANYLQILYVPGVADLSVLCGAAIGAGLGFLWFNAPPAQVFMGDTGSLALGAFLGTIAVATKQELVFLLIGGLFVLETVSVMVQVVSFRLTGRRVFRMAPLHHHFEHKGWSESQIVMRFWIIAFVLATIGLATLKLR